MAVESSANISRSDETKQFGRSFVNILKSLGPSWDSRFTLRSSVLETLRVKYCSNIPLLAHG